MLYHERGVETMSVLCNKKRVDVAGFVLLKELKCVDLGNGFEILS